MSSVRSLCAKFRDLHANGCFVIPNPWDAGSAKYLRHLGFKALATTSSGSAFSRGLPDGAISLANTLEHIAQIVAATDLPVNADFGRGFADEPDEVGQNVAACIGTGVAGLSIEDSTGTESSPLYELELAADRIRAARGAIDESGTGVLLTARAECFLVRHPDPFRDSLRRLVAYAQAGADVLFAPGIAAPHEISELVAAVKPRPVNVLVSFDIGLSVSDLAGMGVRRISVGSGLARTAWTCFISAAKHIAETGSFVGFRGITSGTELNDFFDSSR